MQKTFERSLSTLPLSFKRILWSYEFSRIDPARDAALIVAQTLNYGDLDQWRWIAHRYGAEEIRRILRETPETAIRPGARALAALLFGAREFRHAPRGVRL